MKFCVPLCWHDVGNAKQCCRLAVWLEKLVGKASFQDLELDSCLFVLDNMAGTQ